MSTPLDITCKEVVELVTRYFDGAMVREERTRFETHLCGCGACRLYVRQLRQVRETAGRLAEEDVPPASREALLAAFRDWKKSRGGGSP